jgi:cytochrome c peroxidase
MSKRLGITLLIIASFTLLISSAYKGSASTDKTAYSELYFKDISGLATEFNTLEKTLEQSNLASIADRKALFTELYICRKELKKSDFWTRYLDPYLDANTYSNLNAPLPIEWETEAFDKFAKPYKREGFGLTVLEIMLDSNVKEKEALKKMILPSIAAMPVYTSDSVTKNLITYDHFFLCNRMFLLNLSAIYTTGFECPNNDSIIPELRAMLADTRDIYTAYNSSFTQYPLKEEYLTLYDKLKAFVNSQPSDFKQFDHYTFIRDYVNPLFALNQEYIREYKVHSSSTNDYTLNDSATSIFNKNLYEGQNAMGIYSSITDPKLITEIKEIGKMLFYDPILSGNNERSCVSCHKPTECFTDTSVRTALNFDKVNRLPRNTPSLVNVVHNHLLMWDGKQPTLQSQSGTVITSPTEMGSTETEVLKKVLSCKEYKEAFEKFKKYTYKNKEVTFDHIISAITAYESDFSNYTAPFDNYMNRINDAGIECKKGFNLFMSKAQCGTCHYVPEFNGVRPPYIESEFEVLGVPADNKAAALSDDSGRADVYFSNESFHAFRTSTVRNSSYTKPYMHNGVFSTMQEVLDFYNAGGGVGKGLKVANQTLSPQQLHLTKDEMTELLIFIKSLDENIIKEIPPGHLPLSKDKNLNSRKIGGIY